MFIRHHSWRLPGTLIHPLAGGAMEPRGSIILHFTDGKAEAWTVRPESWEQQNIISVFLTRKLFVQQIVRGG